MYAPKNHNYTNSNNNNNVNSVGGIGAAPSSLSPAPSSSSVTTLPKLHRQDISSSHFVGVNTTSTVVPSNTDCHLEYENSSGDFMKTKIKRKTNTSSSAATTPTGITTTGGGGGPGAVSLTTITSGVGGGGGGGSRVTFDSNNSLTCQLNSDPPPPPPPPLTTTLPLTQQQSSQQQSHSSSSATTINVASVCPSVGGNSSIGTKTSHKERSSKRRSSSRSTTSTAIVNSTSSTSLSTTSTPCNNNTNNSASLPLSVTLPEGSNNFSSTKTPSPNATSTNNNNSSTLNGVVTSSTTSSSHYHNVINSNSSFRNFSHHSPSLLNKDSHHIIEDPYEFSETNNTTPRLCHNFVVDCNVPIKRQKLEPTDCYDMTMTLNENKMNSSECTVGGGAGGGNWSSRSVCHAGVNTQYACHKETMTEEDYFGPCLPGTQVNLNAIVWLESSGILVLNIPWRGRSYVGTLLDCTKHSFAPTNLYTYQPPYETRGGGGRGGRGKRRAYGVNGRISRGVKGRACATRNQAALNNTKSGGVSAHNSGAEDSPGEEHENTNYGNILRLPTIRNGLSSSSTNIAAAANAASSRGDLDCNHRTSSPSSSSSMLCGGTGSNLSLCLSASSCAGKDNIPPRGSSPSGQSSNDDLGFYHCSWADCNHRFSKLTALRYHENLAHSRNIVNACLGGSNNSNSNSGSSGSSKHHHHHHLHNSVPTSPVSPSLRRTGGQATSTPTLPPTPGSGLLVVGTNQNSPALSGSAVVSSTSRPRKSPSKKKHHSSSSSSSLSITVSTSALVDGVTSVCDIPPPPPPPHHPHHTHVTSSHTPKSLSATFVSPMAPGSTPTGIPSSASTSSSVNSNNSSGNKNCTNTTNTNNNNNSNIFFPQSTRTVIAPTVSIPLESSSASLRLPGVINNVKLPTYIPGATHSPSLPPSLIGGAPIISNTNVNNSINSSHSQAPPPRIHLQGSHNLVPGTHICPPVNCSVGGNGGTGGRSGLIGSVSHPSVSVAIPSGGGGSSRSPTPAYYSDISDADSPAPILEKEEDFKSPSDRNSSHLSQPPPALVPAVANGSSALFEGSSSSSLPLNLSGGHSQSHSHHHHHPNSGIIHESQVLKSHIAIPYCNQNDAVSGGNNNHLGPSSILKYAAVGGGAGGTGTIASSANKHALHLIGATQPHAPASSSSTTSYQQQSSPFYQKHALLSLGLQSAHNPTNNHSVLNSSSNYQANVSAGSNSGNPLSHVAMYQPK